MGNAMPTPRLVLDQDARLELLAGYPKIDTMQNVFAGTDSGVTTSKINAVWENEEPVSTKVFQRPTNAQDGKEAVISGWIEAINLFLLEHQLMWTQVNGVGLAMPGPHQRYGVLDRSANPPAAFIGWDVHEDFSRALARAAGRPMRLVMGNDGQFGGVAEARLARHNSKSSVLMLMPGSGLGCAFIDQNGLPLPGDTLGSMEGAHPPAHPTTFKLPSPSPTPRWAAHLCGLKSEASNRLFRSITPERVTLIECRTGTLPFPYGHQTDRIPP